MRAVLRMTARMLRFPDSQATVVPSKICVAVAAESPERLLAHARAALTEEPLCELRLDSLPHPGASLPLLSMLQREFPEARIIATCRRLISGGSFDGSVEDELSILQQAAQAGCRIVDLALETAEAMRPDQHRTLRTSLAESGAALLVSYHDYTSTRDLLPILTRIERYRPQIIKIVSTATRLSENLAVLNLLGQQHSCPLVAIAMGETGLPSRVLGPRAGGLFTFASASEGKPTASGQVNAATLRSLYRVDQLHASTRVFGVAGKPIAQSLSPLMQNTAFASQGIDAVLLPLLTDDAAELIRFIRELPLWGASVTMPLKQTVLPLLDSVDPLAARVGACNTIVREEDGSLHGYNTDLAGVLAPLEARMPLEGARVLIRGAGGAARAAVFGLRDKGAEVWITNRTLSAAERLAEEAGAHCIRSANEAGLPSFFDVLLNAVPTGMTGAAGVTPAHDEDLRAGLVFDMVYNPLETPLIRKARDQGIPVITGLEMFAHQGARQFELWTGRTAPQDAMAEVVRCALEAREQAQHQDLEHAARQ